ncbi:MAG TPA: GNAT family N-acetyltransferase [Gammaproteobacteria bacterium]|jgi:GNAT superfamily N-acetyltransferase
MNVRRPGLDDAASIATLVTQLGYPSAEPQAAARLAALEGHPDIQALVAEQDGRIIGFVGLMVFPAFHRDGLHGYITALVVDESVRGSGAGGALLQAAEAWFAERGVKRVNLTTALRREAAHSFYEKRGYTFTGKRYSKIL